jgi:polyisoprenoid-binding protein YceI
MKNLITAAVLAVSSLAAAATWDIDSAHAAANFTVKHLGITNVNGSLGTVSGKFNVDDKDITKSTLDVSIDVNTIYTGVQKRDDHLKSGDFFDVAKFPAVTFKSTRIEKGSADNKLKITGDLTMHGVTKPVSFEAELSKEIEHPMTAGMMARSATAALTIAREDFGLKYNSEMKNKDFVIGKEVKVSLEIELNKAGPAPKAAAPAKK